MNRLELDSGVSLTDRLAGYWSAVRFEELPDDVIAMTKRVLLDTLCVGVRGADSEETTATFKGVLGVLESTGGSATVWGLARTLPASAAALVNGTSTHAYELDDFAGCGHSGAVVVPAVCAMADVNGADGRTVIRALAAGYDLAARITDGAGGYRPHNERGWHSTGTCGTFGAAAAAASILGLEQEQFMSALGIAGSFAGGTWSFLADGAMTKRFHPGRASENGVSAAIFAKAGLGGPRYVLDAKWGGFYSTYSGEDADPLAAIDGLGEKFRILGTGLKPFPCCRGLHSSIEALITLINEHSIGADDIERIIVHGAERTVRQFAKRDVRTLLDGQFSLPYALAVVADSGEATLEQFCPLRVGSPRVRDLMNRVEVTADRQLGSYDEPDIEVLLRDGRTLKKHVAIAKGAAVRPLSDKEVHCKAEAVAVPVLGQRRFDELNDHIGNLESLDDFRRVSALLRVN